MNQDDDLKAQARAEAKAKIESGEFTTQEQYDAFMASKGFTRPQATSEGVRKSVSAEKSPSLSEEAAGLVRTFMNRATGGLYGKAAGAINEKLGMGPSAEQIAQSAAGFAERNPKTAMVTGLAGDVAPYFVPGENLVYAASKIPRLASALAKAGAVGEKGYQIAKSVPVLRLALPASGKMAAQIAAIEGTRSAAQAEPDENAGMAAIKGILGGELGGRLGEMGGTYLAGRFGPTIGKQSALAREAAASAGEKINQFAESAGFKRADAANEALREMYTKSKPIQDEINKQAEKFSRPIFDPVVLSEAYSALTADASPRFKQTVLSPFLDAINSAFDTSLGKGVGEYKQAMNVGRAIKEAEATGKYLRKGAGEAADVGPEVLLQRMNRPFVSEAERQAAAQALIASLREASTGYPRGMVRSALSSLKGLGPIADVAQQLGGTPNTLQQYLQRAGVGIGASR